VNFYSDTNRKNYIGERHPGTGSFSALWVSRDQVSCSRTCGSMIICADSNCGRRKAVGEGQCVSFSGGVWARNGCGNDMCRNA
ncbi:hypothetical protein BCR34DRAFT_495884, partial [Clohesyomyces aquaticus]